MAAPIRPAAKSRALESREAIATETHTSIDEVERMFEQELSALAVEARITQYLGVLASRRVRLKLRKH